MSAEMFQSLFYWNNSVEFSRRKNVTYQRKFQSLFYWNNSVELHRPPNPIFRTIPSFNPCSIGITL